MKCEIIIIYCDVFNVSHRIIIHLHNRNITEIHYGQCDFGEVLPEEKYIKKELSKILFFLFPNMQEFHLTDDLILSKNDISNLTDEEKRVGNPDKIIFTLYNNDGSICVIQNKATVDGEVLDFKVYDKFFFNVNKYTKELLAYSDFIQKMMELLGIKEIPIKIKSFHCCKEDIQFYNLISTIIDGTNSYILFKYFC